MPFPTMFQSPSGYTAPSASQTASLTPKGTTGGGGSAFGAAMIANAITGVVQSIESGRVAMAQARYNAAILEGKAKWMDFQKDIVGQQYDRARGKMIGKSIVATAGANLRFSGSPQAVTQDSVTQLNIDRAIQMANIDMEKQYTLNAAEMELVKGRNEVRAQRVNAYSSVLNSAESYGMYKGLSR